MELSARTIEDRRFAASVNGYRKRDVEAFLKEAAAYVSHLEEQLAIQRTKADKATKDLTAMTERIEAELDEARLARERIIDEARSEAETIVRTAHRRGTTAPAPTAIIQEAETEAHRKLADVEAIADHARAEADRVMREAEEHAARREAEADRVLDEAHAESARLHAETQRYRAEMEENLAEIKRILGSTRGPAPAVDIGTRDDIVVDLRREQAARAATDG